MAQPACQPGRLPARHPRRERVAGRGHGSPARDASSRHERWSWALVVSAGRRLESRARVAVVGRFSQATRQLTWQPTTKPKEAADLAATPGKSPHSPRAVPRGSLHSRDGFAGRGSQILRKSTSGLQWPHNGLTMATQWPLVIYTVAVLLSYF